MGIDVVVASSGVGNHLVCACYVNTDRVYLINTFQQDHLIIPTGYNCPLPDSMWALFTRPTVLVRELYNYIRHGTGWLLGTIVELEVFGSSSLVGETGQVNPIPKERMDPFDPQNIPDIAVLPVSLYLTCSPHVLLMLLISRASRISERKEQIDHKDLSASMLLYFGRCHAAVFLFALLTQWMHLNVNSII